MQRFSLRLAVFLLLVSLLSAQERVDLTTVHRIRYEALQNSKVMDYLWQLTEVNGPRLTNSPGFRRAGEWAAKQLNEMGLKNVKLEKWGPFGQGWENTRFSAHLVEPTYSPLIGFQLAWSAGTEGPVTAEVMHVPALRTDADMEKWKGKLKGKILIMEPEKALTPQDRAALMRYTPDQLNDMFLAPDPGQRSPFGGPPPSAGGPGQPPMSREQAQAQRRKLNGFLKDEGVLAVLSLPYRGDGGTVFGAAAGSREVKDPIPPASIALTPEHYNRIFRLVQKKIPVKVELDVQARFYPEETDSFNVIAELPGTGKKKDEVVMIGAHLDSWHGAQGATDNAAGTAVMMEVMRVLKALDLKLDRTVRIALWGGEEQGLLGSRAYVKERFADRETMKVTSEHGKMSAYYNLDNGTGKIRGIYLQANDMARPVFEAWLAPFKDLGATTVSIRNTGGTDHQSFDAVGLPGFQFIQDAVEYSTRTHHSNMDTYDRIQKGDMMQASAIIASFVYHTAMREEMIPRKPLPKPQPRGAEGAKPLPTE
ncbi:MAG: M20/M25/M40 family metallo-hydrolase [Bryobacteraceae bacterium]|nr:M20/M25/M40 family metallo-hydrolase [Bryobacteraceae bacterium]